MLLYYEAIIESPPFLLGRGTHLTTGIGPAAGEIPRERMTFTAPCKSYCTRKEREREIGCLFDRTSKKGCAIVVKEDRK